MWSRFAIYGSIYLMVIGIILMIASLPLTGKDYQLAIILSCGLVNFSFGFIACVTSSKVWKEGGMVINDKTND